VQNGNQRPGEPEIPRCVTTGQPQPSKLVLSSSSRSLVSAEPAASRQRRSLSARTM